jgi:hypothetical protein
LKLETDPGIGFLSAKKVRHAVKVAPRYRPLAALQH